MEQKQLADLTEEELLEAKKKMKSSKITYAVLIGVFAGVAVYSAANNGFGFSTFFPLFFVYLLLRNGNKSKALEEELKSRNLQ